MKFDNKDQKVRGRTGRITQRGHEFYGRYMWSIEIFRINKEGKPEVLFEMQSLEKDRDQTYATEDKARKDLLQKIERTVSNMQLLAGRRGNEGFEFRNGFFVPRGL